MVDPLVGAVLDGRYRIRGRIARGGMATVYDALDERLERTVAVKVMHPNYAADPMFIDRFIREAKAAAGLNHPNVVAVFDQGSHDGLAFLVMELVPGVTLRDVLAERGRLSTAEAVTVLESVLNALSAAHRSGLVHRDIKPENVLISVDGVAKVADFGLARAVEASTQTATGNVVMGTVAYVSPEQIINGHADTRSDVYSAGIMLFEMLTGSVPYGGDSAVNIAFQHVNSDIPAPTQRVPAVPVPLDELTVRATRREPGARPADAGAFLAELRDVRTDLALPVSTVAAPAPQATSTHTTRAVPAMGSAGPPQSPIQQMLAQQATQPTPRRRRSRAGFIAAAILVTLGLVAAGTGWWLGAGRFTEAPSLMNLTKVEAEKKAKDNGFTVTYRDAEYSETVKPNVVMRQNPEPNARILSGGAIVLVLSRGPERYAVPPVSGLPTEQAKKALTDKKLKWKLASSYHASIPDGRAISTDPKTGTALRRDTVVTLVISKGPKPIDLPDLVGKPRAEAEQILAGLGLKASVTEQEVPDPGQNGKVLTQAPGPGQVPPGSTVALTVAKGPALVEVPQLVGKKKDEAESELTARGLKMKTEREGSTVFLQLPPAGSQVPPGTEVTVWLAG